MPRLSLCLILFLAGACAQAHETAPDHPVGSLFADGWTEAVIAVSDPEQTAAMMADIGNWRPVAEDPTFIGAPNEAQGLIRLIDAEPCENCRPGRVAARLWETGGIAGLNFRVDNARRAFMDLLDAGWMAYSGPVAFDLQQFTVVESLLQNRDGWIIGLIERRNPPLEGWANLDGLSRAANAFAVVDDLEAAERFYTETLGFRVTLRNEGPLLPEPGPNIFGLPHNIAAATQRRIIWVAPPAAEQGGTIALMQFEGLAGHDFDAPGGHLWPQHGVRALRYPVIDPAVLKNALAAFESVSCHGGAPDCMALVAPGGMVLEFFKKDSEE